MPPSSPWAAWECPSRPVVQARLRDAFFAEAWETGSETAGDRPKVTQEFPLQLWTLSPPLPSPPRPPFGLRRPNLRQSRCSAHVA